MRLARVIIMGQTVEHFLFTNIQQEELMHKVVHVQMITFYP